MHQPSNSRKWSAWRFNSSSIVLLLCSDMYHCCSSDAYWIIIIFFFNNCSFHCINKLIHHYLEEYMAQVCVSLITALKRKLWMFLFSIFLHFSILLAHTQCLNYNQTATRGKKTVINKNSNNNNNNNYYNNYYYFKNNIRDARSRSGVWQTELDQQCQQSHQFWMAGVSVFK